MLLFVRAAAQCVCLNPKTAKSKPYPTDPQTVGDRLKKRRHELGLYQKDTAALLRVTQGTLIRMGKG